MRHPKLTAPRLLDFLNALRTFFPA
jgi:hypothetical protein